MAELTDQEGFSLAHLAFRGVIEDLKRRLKVEPFDSSLPQRIMALEEAAARAERLSRGEPEPDSPRRVLN